MSEPDLLLLAHYCVDAPRTPFAQGKGFLYPVHQHVVTAQTIGSVHEGRNKREAERAFRRWSKFAAAPVGRAAGKKVTHLTDNKITNEN